MMQDENEKKLLIEFVKETKIASLNKMNNATFKFGTLFVFIMGSLLFALQNLPSNRPDLHDYYIASILVNYFIGISVISSHIFNAFFRKVQQNKNAEKKWNEMEIKYMFPLQMVSFIQMIIFIFIILVMFVFCFYFELEFWRIMLQFIALLYLIYFMGRNAIKKIKPEEQNEKIHKKIIDLIIFLIIIISSLYNFPFIIDLIFDHRLVTVYCFYFVGCFWALSLIFKAFSYRIIYSWVEDFYNEIHISDLSLDEIKNKLKLEFSAGRNIETITFNNDR
ncbi:hypothetical protein [Paenibacillus terrae]|nr:hypothetical protein [Paenibacillus terrae]